MLVEFAFTPSVFEEAAHKDLDAWREQIRDLGNSMFPRTAAWPVMVSDLYSGSWHKHVLRIVQAIRDTPTRMLCQKLLENASKILVARPATKAEYPGDDSIEWGREAIESHATEPIDRIITCRPSHASLFSAHRFIRCMDEVGDSGFWSEIVSQWPQDMRISDQVETLRKICVHSEFLALITPYIKGGGDDETDFAVALVKSAFQRPRDFPQVEIEIHTEGPDTRAGGISHMIRAALAPAQKVRLLLWPRFVDRYLIGGVYTERSNGTRVRSPRWGVAMQHIARKADGFEPKPATSWALLQKRQLVDVFDRYCTGESQGMIYQANITTTA